MNTAWHHWLVAAFVLAGFGHYTFAAVGAVIGLALWFAVPGPPKP
jgi:hypothetical protein